jgi:hypothetical protein
VRTKLSKEAKGWSKLGPEPLPKLTRGTDEVNVEDLKDVVRISLLCRSKMPSKITIRPLWASANPLLSNRHRGLACRCTSDLPCAAVK